MSNSLIIGFLLAILLIFIYTGCKFRTNDLKAIKQFRKVGITLIINNFQKDKQCIHYAQTGNSTAPSIVFLHGTPGSWNNFVPYMQDSQLVQQFRMIAIDRPGLGYSNFGKALPMQEQVNLIAELLLKLQNGKPTYLVGHSLGAPVAAWLAADFQELTNGIFLISGSLSPALEPKERWRFAMKRKGLRWLLPGAFRPSNDELVYFKKDVLALAKKLPNVQWPVNILHARNDMFVPVGNVEFMQQSFVNSSKIETTVWDKGNHFLPFNRIPQIKEMLLHFCK